MANRLGNLLTTSAHAGSWKLRTEHELVGDDMRGELLERLGRGEYPTLFLRAVTFSQAPGVRNRNFVRFNPERLPELAASGVDTPFLRDHAQHSMKAIGGTVLSSTIEAAGAVMDLVQEVRLTSRWSLRRALDQTLRGFSIGWNNIPAPGALSPLVTCSVCSRPVRECAWELGHYKGTEVAGQIVEWIIDNAELVETSAVPVPAVREVRPLDVREELSPAALAAELQTFGVSVQVPRALTQETSVDLSKIIAALGLPVDATEETVLATIRARARTSELATHAALSTEIAELKAENAKLRTAADGAVAEARNVEARAWADQLVADGKLAPQGPLYEHVVELRSGDKAKAEELAASLPVVTPVAKASQSAERTGAALTLDDLVEKLSAEDRHACAAMAKKLSTAKRPMSEKDAARAFIKSNYHELAVNYGWPKEMP
jgi:hypothetical protein